MRKIPTVFLRDPDDMRRVTRDVHPDCKWVLTGEGTATRKYDGTCVMLDDFGLWWARREVKPGKKPPANYQPIGIDDTTGKTVGWEPIGQSAFVKFHTEALAAWADRYDASPGPGTYELLGPKINGNPEWADVHCLVRHAWAMPLPDSPRDFEGLAEWLTARRYEGIVWHHPDGRMAKLKRRDFPTERAEEDET